ncbi:MAG: hypothetical protein AAF074_03435 [Pseudomonadota bacterium]
MNSDEQAAARRRALLWPALAVLGPLIVYFVLTPIVFHAIGPHEKARALLALKPLDGNLLAAELPQRLSYTLATLVLFAASLTGIAYAVATLFHRRGPGMAAIAFLAALIAGTVGFVGDEQVTADIKAGGYALLAWLDPIVNSGRESVGETLRAVVVTGPLATLPKGQQALGPETRDQMLWLTAMAAAMGLAATGALLVRFAEIAWSDPDKAHDRPEDLRQRWAALRNTLLLGAIILTLAVLATRAYYAWPLSMLDEASATLLGPIASTAAGFWGTIYTLVLLSAALPAVIALHTEIDAEARLREPVSAKRVKWREDNMLKLYPPEAISAALATAAPLIASPAVTAFTGLLG